MSLPEQPHFDDLYEYYDPQQDPDPLPQRQQQRSTPLSQRRPQSSQSSSVRSLRRTPRLQERRLEATRSPLRARRSQSLAPTPPVRFDESGSTTPSVFQRLVSNDTYRPRRTLHISRHAHDAILFALEAIRRGDGVNAQPLTTDPLEEEARMSDLVRGTAPGTAAASGRPQNGGPTRAAAAAGSGPTPAEIPRYLTPTDVMRERRAREARRAEEAAARLRQEEDTRRLQEEQTVGVGEDTARRRTARTGAQPTQTYNIGGQIPQPAAPAARRQENIPPNQQSASRTTARAPQPGLTDPRLSESTQRNRTEAYEQLNIPAPSKPFEQNPRATQQSQAQPRAQPTAQPVQQPGTQTAGGTGRNRFPNAFERWEDLSAQWEGIVSSFIHRMEQNADELAGKPIDRQMARQVDDLSRAGANLFHAVVELQRLRASSERKFQRWFFETRHEQEQAQERQAQLENQLRAEREARTVSSSSIEQVRADKSRADELVKEMRRELQISKEEARRAWEELGRREQEERERTIALRSGEPTVIGGVQVVPMQGLPSRQTSTAQRPLTAHGPTATAGPTTMTGQQPLQQQRPSSRQTTTTSLDSPGEETRQFSFRPEADISPTVTDPFTQSSRQQTQVRREPDAQFYTTPPRPTQPASSGAAMAAARAAATSGVTSPGRIPEQPRYYQSATNPQMSGALPTPARQGTGGTETSYIPSNASLAPSEEEYHINPDGSYTRDSEGRRIPYRQPLERLAEDEQASGEEGEISEEISDDDDDDDHAADAERERMYAQQYRQTGQQQLPPTTNESIPRTTSGALPPIPQGQIAPDYEGQGYEQEDPSVPTPSAVTQAMTGWESLQTRTHRHPTRLSDILEEQTARTSPSRTSYVSGSGGLPGDPGSGPGSATGRGGNSSARR